MAKSEVTFMESYGEFLHRIDAFEKKVMSLGDADFHTNPSLAQKADEQGRFLPFWGDTVVFDLDSATKSRLADITQRIYVAATECFSEKLIPDTFHMTLHDLSNGTSLETLADAMAENAAKVKTLFKDLPRQTIRLRSKAIFNMVNTSLVLGLYPADEEEYRKLMALYALFDEVRQLPYPFTPHITLAYFRPKGFDIRSARKLEAIVNSLNEQEFAVTLDTRNLTYQHFSSMNDYRNEVGI